MDNEQIQAAMRRAVEAAERGRANPEIFLSGRFTGRSRTGTATAWVDPLGRLERLELAPGSVQEGDEEGVAAAVLEAYTEARQAAAELALRNLPDWAPEAPSADDDDYSTASPLNQEPR